MSRGKTFRIDASQSLHPDRELQAVEIGGMPIHAITLEETVQFMLDCIHRGLGGWVLTPNVDILRRWNRDHEFRELTAAATLCVADGMPLVWASRLQGTPLPQRVNGTDLVAALLPKIAEQGISTFFLGGDPGVADEAAQRLRKQLPLLEIVGTYCPPFGFETENRQFQLMEAALVAAQPSVVFVGLGSPKQDIVIRYLRQRQPHTWWLGVGATFNFLSGRIRRAPNWMQHCGLEWLHRLVHEPRRLGQRYLVDDVPFATSLLLQSCWRRFNASPTPRKQQTDVKD